jgi:guanylate kinase
MKRQRGKLIVISAPSGCGKTTITNALLKRHPHFSFSVSATTRKKRHNEIDGKHYYFLTEQEFTDAIRNEELVEWENIYGNYYGTLKRVVDTALETGTILLFDVDVKGGISIQKKYPGESVLVFIEPPSLEALKRRLQQRNTEDDFQLKRRLERVPMELEQGKFYTYSVVNDDLATAIAEIDSIVQKEIQSVS